MTGSAQDRPLALRALTQPAVKALTFHDRCGSQHPWGVRTVSVV